MLLVKPILPEHWPLLRTIRLWALADAPEAFCTTLAEAQAYSDEEWQVRARRFSEKPPATGCLAFWDDAPCGMACAYRSAEDTQTAGLTSFWVAPEHRGKGVAEAMVEYIAEWALSQGMAGIEADVVEDNHRAIAFYKRAGFNETGRSEPFRGNPSKIIIRLAKTL